jgi:hypothetical protein
MKQLDLARLWSKVAKQSSPCWTWIGGRTATGYGKFAVEYHSVVAHRVVYEVVRGPIPENMTLDHLCKNILCVNPDHMEVVTLSVNCSRIVSSNREKTHCPAGHEYNAENTVYTRQRKDAKHRTCRICRNAAAKRQRERLDVATPVRTLTHNSAKTHCKRGHEFTLANTYLLPKSNGRRCLACRRVREHPSTKRPQGRQRNALMAAAILTWMSTVCGGFDFSAWLLQ